MESKEMFNQAILLLVFNRPTETSALLTAIQNVKPTRLYISCDGPRHEEDEKKIEEIKQLVERHITWKCDLKTRFNDVNMGCGKSVSSGISWFFQHEDMGIILEDDCIPVLSFFSFCDNLLDKYKDDHRVGMISGTNLVNQWKAKKYDYFFSYYGSIWGWATWKRAWDNYSFDIEDFEERKNELRGCFHSEKQFNKRLSEYESVYHKKIDTWDYQWSYCRLKHKMLSIVPTRNMIKNIGFNEDATHTTNLNARESKLKTHNLSGKTDYRGSSYGLLDKDYEFISSGIRLLRYPSLLKGYILGWFKL